VRAMTKQGHQLLRKKESVSSEQWHRQDLLRGGAKIEIMSWGTHGGLRGRVKQLPDDYNSFVTNAVLIDRAVSC